MPAVMDKKQQFLLLRIEKAGVRASRRSGHLISRDELLDLRIQVIPFTLRITVGLLAAASAWASYTFHAADASGPAFGFGVLAVLLFLFALFGVRRTIGRILDSMDGLEMAEVALECIAKAFASVFD
jgi:hypothetical protein